MAPRVSAYLDGARVYRANAKGRPQPRLVVPISTRIRSATAYADVLVSLSKGLAGKRRDHAATARKLGLRRWGDQALLRSLDAERMGMALKIRHLVTITYLPHSISIEDVRHEEREGALEHGGYITGTHQRWSRLADFGSPQWLARVRWEDHVKTVALLPGTGVTGGYFEFDNEEYLQVEVSPKASYVTWSSALDVGPAIEALSSSLGAPRRWYAGFLIDLDGSVFEEGAHDIIQRARANPDGVRTVSVGLAGGVASWRRSQIKMREGKVPHVEMTVGAKNLAVSRILALIDETATRNVREALADNAAPLIESLGTQRRH